MATWFVSRHPGALEWLRRQGLSADRIVSHLEPGEVLPGDTVIGNFPVNLVADLCARGVCYLHLGLCVPAEWRGRELTADQLDACGAVLQAFHVRRIQGLTPISRNACGTNADSASTSSLGSRPGGRP